MIVGLMSGTSLDGLDIALCRISGSGTHTRVELEAFHTWPYSRKTRAQILSVFAQPQIDFQTLTELNASIGELHGGLVVEALNRWGVNPNRVDLIASHGQTVFHSPRFLYPGAKRNSTLQIGDGDHVAVSTGIITISDFRQKHIAAGGEGAPLAVYGDYLLFSKRGENRLLLNAGGIGNFTFLPDSAKANEVFVTDTGPANTLIDQAVRKLFPGLTYDRNARIARQGSWNPDLLKALKSHPFFKRSFPKTIGPELFNLQYVEQAQRQSGTEAISSVDLMATLTRFSSETMAEAILKAIGKRNSFQLYTSGGGAHNPLMMAWLQELLPQFQFHAMEKLGIPGDAKEAVLFAVLANEALAGGSVNFGPRSNIPSVAFGKISFPR